jgi:hypothetical protein
VKAESRGHLSVNLVFDQALLRYAPIIGSGNKKYKFSKYLILFDLIQPIFPAEAN